MQIKSTHSFSTSVQYSNGRKSETRKKTRCKTIVQLLFLTHYFNVIIQLNCDDVQTMTN